MESLTAEHQHFVMQACSKYFEEKVYFQIRKFLPHVEISYKTGNNYAHIYFGRKSVHKCSFYDGIHIYVSPTGPGEQSKVAFLPKVISGRLTLGGFDKSVKFSWKSAEDMERDVRKLDGKTRNRLKICDVM